METPYSVTTQPVHGTLIRFHSSPDATFGDSYFGTCFVESLWGVLWWRWWLFRRAIAHVFAVTMGREINLRQFGKINREVEKRLYEMGYRVMRYERRSGLHGERLLVKTKKLNPQRTFTI